MYRTVNKITTRIQYVDKLNKLAGIQEKEIVLVDVNTEDEIKKAIAAQFTNNTVIVDYETFDIKKQRVVWDMADMLAAMPEWVTIEDVEE